MSVFDMHRTVKTDECSFTTSGMLQHYGSIKVCIIIIIIIMIIIIVITGR